MKHYINKILFAVIAVICFLDAINISSNIFFIISGFVVSYGIFQFGTSKYKFERKTGIVLFVANLLFFIISLSYRIYLFNILLLSALIWSMITPLLINYKNLNYLSICAAFAAIYISSLTGTVVPVLPLVFYPVYLTGYASHHITQENTKDFLPILLINIVSSALVLSVLFFKVRGLSILQCILYSKYHKLPPGTGAYLSFITFFYFWMSINVNRFISFFISKPNHCTSCEGQENSFFIFYRRLSINILAFFFTIGLLTFISEYTSRTELMATLRALLTPQSIFNIIFFGSIYLTLISFLGKGLSTIVVSIVALLLAFANFIKITFFDEPFYPWDVYLIKNAFMISKQYLNIKIISILIITFAAICYLAVKFRAKLLKAFKPTVLFSLLPAAIVFLILNISALQLPDLFPGLNMSKSWYVGKDEILANGFFVQNYFYLTDLKKYLFNKPQDYSYEKMLALSDKLSENSSSNKNTGKKPNVVVIMSESFWDPTKLKGVTFSEDITRNVRKYQKGELVSPVVGGATANTEFEALTGFSMYFLGPGTIPYNVYLRRDTPSLADVFKDNGYSTVALHPNVGDFYNRAKVYKYFGFDNFIDVNSFDPSKDCKGPYISDDKFVDKILEVLESSDSPKFIFAVSIQNHDPYFNVYSNLQVHAQATQSGQLNETDINILSNYAQGIHDADRSLGKLIGSLDKSGTPTLVYFFGDHLPRLGNIQNMYEIYHKLDFSDNENILKDINFYKTPVAVWSNYTEVKPFDTNISPAQLAFDVLKNSNIKYPTYFNILHKLRENNPYLHANFKESVNLNDEAINEYRLIQYDLLFGEQYLTK